MQQKYSHHPIRQIYRVFLALDGTYLFDRLSLMPPTWLPGIASIPPLSASSFVVQLFPAAAYQTQGGRWRRLRLKRIFPNKTSFYLLEVNQNTLPPSSAWGLVCHSCIVVYFANPTLRVAKAKCCVYLGFMLHFALPLPPCVDVPFVSNCLHTLLSLNV